MLDLRISERVNLPRTRLRGFESGKIGPVDGCVDVCGIYGEAVFFVAILRNLLPDSYIAEVGFFLVFANVLSHDHRKECQSFALAIFKYKLRI